MRAHLGERLAHRLLRRARHRGVPASHHRIVQIPRQPVVPRDLVTLVTLVTLGVTVRVPPGGPTIHSVPSRRPVVHPRPVRVVGEVVAGLHGRRAARVRLAAYRSRVDPIAPPLRRRRLAPLAPPHRVVALVLPQPCCPQPFRRVPASLHRPRAERRHRLPQVAAHHRDDAGARVGVDHARARRLQVQRAGSLEIPPAGYPPAFLVAQREVAARRGVASRPRAVEQRRGLGGVALGVVCFSSGMFRVVSGDSEVEERSEVVLPLRAPLVRRRAVQRRGFGRIRRVPSPTLLDHPT
mmetsp:Transcript_13468/g.56988  ORF Transcript_13468/g.56988 Transcript_13468/m.56988 type:complete len:295 (+) Transcript_13468:1850-2734(+)